MEFLISLLLLVSAGLLSVLAVKGLLRKPKDQSPKPGDVLTLPVVGDPGTESCSQRARLQKARLDAVALDQLSKEQAEILLSCVHYVEGVWEDAFEDDRSALPPDLRQNAVRVILTHESYLDCALALERSSLDVANRTLAKDNCYRHVVAILTQDDETENRP